VADQADINKSRQRPPVDAILDAIGATLKKGEEVRLVGFGTFVGDEARRRRSPQSAHGRNDQDQGLARPRSSEAGNGLKASVNG
jgi:DNA-binding protein HU-beta